ncbi:MAG: hypothetical protein CSA74_07630 [Rhodobacterales bacterium]|nr:MAG: hypothetical protein CSA74_07630 [Rhodobacterales bacterium]
MSAIDWLSDSVTTAPVPDGTPAFAPFATGTEYPGITVRPVDPVSVAPLDAPDTDMAAIGILPASVTGLPSGLWGDGRPEDVARRIATARPDMLPALQALLQTILLAELDPPRGGAPTPEGGRRVFLARVDKLLEMGALDQANALLERAPQDEAQIIRRHFDAALLLGEEQPLCEGLAATPDLSPTYQARIFCLARAGDWSGAALLLGTGSALDLIPEDDADLFARFLDPDLFEGEPPLPIPRNPTPLTFRMYEAIGQAIPTQGLPLAFAQSDLRSNIGWKARIEAGERLARTGAVSDNQLYGLYSERRAAASGGVWTRVAAVQKAERALHAGQADAVAEALPGLWEALSEARVEVPISRILGPRLDEMGLEGEAGEIAFRMALLSDEYEAHAARAVPVSAFDRLLVATARGVIDADSGRGIAAGTALGERARAVVDGFTADAPPARLAGLVRTNRLGEAILRAITLLAEGTSGDLDRVTDALALLRAVGLEDTARRTALEFLILDWRG